MAEENGKTSDRLNITREDLAELRGVVTTSLRNIEGDISDIKNDNKYFRDVIIDLGKRVGYIENIIKAFNNAKKGWREWLIIGLPGWMVAAIAAIALFTRR